MRLATVEATCHVVSRISPDVRWPSWSAAIIQPSGGLDDTARPKVSGLAGPDRFQWTSRSIAKRFSTLQELIASPDHHVPVRFKPKIRTFEPRYRGKVSSV